MLANWPLLSLLVWLPMLSGVLVLLLAGRSSQMARWLSLIASLAIFLLSLPLAFGFDVSQSAMQFVERYPWVPSFHVEYFLGVDGISMPLVLLTTFTTVLVVLAGWDVIEEKTAQYMAAFLIMEGMMIGTFAALDAIQFYFFFEGMLIPMYLVIGIWGGHAAFMQR